MICEICKGKDVVKNGKMELMILDLIDLCMAHKLEMPCKVEGTKAKRLG